MTSGNGIVEVKLQASDLIDAFVIEWYYILPNMKLYKRMEVWAAVQTKRSYSSTHLLKFVSIDPSFSLNSPVLHLLLSCFVDKLH